MKVEGYIDGPNEQRYNWNLVYLFDDDTVYFSKNFLDSTLKVTQNGYLKSYDMVFCNVFIGGGDIWGCMNRLRGKIDVKIYLKNVDEEKGILLAQKTIDMNAFYRSILLTQVYFGKNRDKYIIRKDRNINWDKMQSLILNNSNDTIYHYTAWFKGQSDSENRRIVLTGDKYLVEIP